MNSNAVSVYQQDDAMDDFPVLKAFQQYVDAEQAKARKRLMMLAVFFGAFTLAIIAVFVSLLIAAGNRNQALNDKILEYVMKERSQPVQTAAPVVVQQPANQDNAAIMAMSSKLEEMRKQLQENEARTKEAEQKARDAEARAAKDVASAAKPKQPTAEELEINRLKALLAAEREKASEEKKRRYQEELEAYRRKHYPELYAPKKVEKAENVKKVENIATTPARNRRLDDAELDDIKPINYFDDDTEIEEKPAPRKTVKKPAVKPAAKPTAKLEVAPVKKPAAVEEKTVKQSEIPVKISGVDTAWQIPD